MVLGILFPKNVAWATLNEKFQEIDKLKTLRSFNTKFKRIIDQTFEWNAFRWANELYTKKD